MVMVGELGAKPPHARSNLLSTPNWQGIFFPFNILVTHAFIEEVQPLRGSKPTTNSRS
jgi:hypothetical protein